MPSQRYSSSTHPQLLSRVNRSGHTQWFLHHSVEWSLTQHPDPRSSWPLFSRTQHQESLSIPLIWFISSSAIHQLHDPSTSLLFILPWLLGSSQFSFGFIHMNKWCQVLVLCQDKTRNISQFVYGPRSSAFRKSLPVTHTSEVWIFFWHNSPRHECEHVAKYLFFLLFFGKWVFFVLLVLKVSHLSAFCVMHKKKIKSLSWHGSYWAPLHRSNTYLSAYQQWGYRGHLQGMFTGTQGNSLTK